MEEYAHMTGGSTDDASHVHHVMTLKVRRRKQQQQRERDRREREKVKRKQQQRKQKEQQQQQQQDSSQVKDHQQSGRLDVDDDEDDRSLYTRLDQYRVDLGRGGHHRELDEYSDSAARHTSRGLLNNPVKCVSDNIVSNVTIYHLAHTLWYYIFVFMYNMQ